MGVNILELWNKDLKIPFMSESSIGVCAVKLNLALACPSLLFSFFDKVHPWNGG